MHLPNDYQQTQSLTIVKQNNKWQTGYFEYLKMLACIVIFSGKHFRHFIFPVYSGFDELVQKSKGEAEEAMKQVPEIQALIDEAKEKTKQANEALSGAEQNATLAQKLAIEAKDISEMAAKV